MSRKGTRINKGSLSYPCNYPCKFCLIARAVVNNMGTRETRSYHPLEAPGPPPNTATEDLRKDYLRQTLRA